MASPTLQSRFISAIPVLLVLIWIGALIPSLLLGFGSDADAWSIAANAEQIWQTGEYSASRSTGFPLYELLITPVIMLFGSVGSNLVSLLFGLACLYAFYRILKESETENWFVLVFTFAFLPIFMKNAASTMDYLPALSLLLFAWLALVQKKWWPAFLLIGFAVGFRPTHLAFLFPALILAWQGGRNWSSLLVYALGTGATALLAYSPVLIEYGFLNPLPGTQFDFSLQFLIWGYNASLLFGVLPTLGLVGMLIFYGIKNGKTAFQTGSFPWQFHFVNLCIWVILFTLMPHEPEYLLPAVPSVLLLSNALLPRSALIVLSMILLSGHFFRVDLLGGESGQRKIEVQLKRGVAHWDRRDRKFKRSLRTALDDFEPADNLIFMEGASYVPVLNEQWTYLPELRLYKKKGSNLYLSHPILAPDALKSLRENGFRLVVWNQRKWQYTRSGSDEWREYVEVVDDLEAFLGTRIVGEPLK